jgi:transposase-like protein
MPEPPPVDVKRWTPGRKAAVLAMVKRGEVTVEEACRRYEISREEFSAWLQAFETYGLPGLRTTRSRLYQRRPSLRRRGRRS